MRIAIHFSPVSSLFALLATTACIDDKDLAVGSQTGAGGSGSGGAGAGASSPEASDSSSGNDGNSGTSVGEAQTESGTSTGGTSGGTSGAQSPEQSACENSGGVWDPGSCGHYVCGASPDCRAVIPGCDCGVGGIFVEGLGCEADDACESLEFDCGGSPCVAPGFYCDVWGASINCDPTPASCEGIYTCACLEQAGVLDGGTCERQDDGSLVLYVPGGP